MTSTANTMAATGALNMAASDPAAAEAAASASGVRLSRRLRHLRLRPVPSSLRCSRRRARWVRWLPWLVVALVFAGFAFGFSKSAGLGQQLVVEWVVINGALSALGTAIALGHPLSIVTAFIAAPITSLNPTIGAGMVVAAVEVWLRKPRVGDFSTLKSDVTSVKGWWRNRVSRTLLVFLGATLGSAAGTYIAGFRIVGQLFG